MKIRITKWGNSLALRIPKIFAVHLGIKIDSEMDIDVKEGQIILKPLEEESLDDLIACITPENRHEMIEWGDPIGNEAW